MNFKFYLYLFFILLIAISCDEETVDVDLPYKKQFVVAGFISANNVGEIIFITKTIPPLDNIENGNNLLDNPIITISKSDRDYYYSKNCSETKCQFYENNELIPEKGDILKFKVDAEGVSAEAEVKIPNVNSIDLNVYYKIKTYSEFNIEIDVYFEYFMDTNYCYQYIDNFNFEAELFLGNNKITKYLAYTFYTDSSELQNRIDELKTSQFTMHIYQKEYKKYWDTRYNGNEGDGIFTNPVNINGNIKNGIGYLIGKQFLVVNPNKIEEIK